MANMLGQAPVTVHGVLAKTARAYWRSAGQSLPFMALSDVSMSVRQPTQTYVELGSNRVISVYGTVDGTANARGTFMPKSAKAGLREASDPCGSASSLEIKVYSLCNGVGAGQTITAKPAVLTGFGVSMRVQDMLISASADFEVKGMEIT